MGNAINFSERYYMPRSRRRTETKAPNAEEPTQEVSLEESIKESLNKTTESYTLLDFHLIAEAWCNYLYSRVDPTAPIVHTDVMRMQAIWDRHIGARLDSTPHYLDALALDTKATLIDFHRKAVKGMEDNG